MAGSSGAKPKIRRERKLGRSFGDEKQRSLETTNQLR
jgi:hypothetical protein